MPLVEIELPIQPAPLPEEVDEFLREADARIAAYYESQTVRTAGFVPSDFPLVFHALKMIVEMNLAAGHSFCEWGSGFGVVASLAAMLEFDAYGIEVDRNLVDAARNLAADFGLPVEFVHGSFIPPGDDVLADEACADSSNEIVFLVTDAGAAYDELGLSPDDADVIFAYPWPGERSAIEVLFEHNAAEGALLLTYNSFESVRLQRRVRRKPRR